MTLWQRLDSTAKKLVVMLTVAGILGGWAVSFISNTKVNAMALQRSIDAEVRRDERVSRLEADAATTKASTSASIDRIAAAVEGQAQANAETARQVKDTAAQIAKTQAQLAQVSDLSVRISALERVIPKLSDEVNELTKAATKLRKKVKEEPTP